MERKVFKMKESMKIQLIADFAKAHANDSKEANNICETVCLCCQSTMETYKMCVPIHGYTSDFFMGVLFGKVHFLDQLVLLMSFHMGTDLTELLLDSEMLYAEAIGEGGEE